MKKLLPIICLTTSCFCIEPFSQTSFDPIEILPPVILPPHKSPFITVGLSALFPGLGHVYLGDYKTASGLMGSTSVYYSLYYLKPHPETFNSVNFNLISNTWLYGIYAAYRDVRAYNSADIYCYPMPKETLTELALAPFQWSVMKKPEVWGALLVDLTLAIGLEYLASFSHVGHDFPLMAFPVGIGEEAFFRGYLQSRLSETFSPWGGIAVSSLAFGAAHIPNASGYTSKERRYYYTSVLPFITVMGGYFGWLTYKNCSLKEAVAIHCWYDFAIFLASYSLSKSVTQTPFVFSVPF